MIASIDLTTSLRISVVCDERLLGQRPHRALDGLLGLVGLRLELLSQQRVEFVGFNGRGLRLRRPAAISGQP